MEAAADPAHRQGGQVTEPVDLVLLNEARRWWLEHMPWTGSLPTDDEVLRAYADAFA